MRITEYKTPLIIPVCACKADLRDVKYIFKIIQAFLRLYCTNNHYKVYFQESIAPQTETLLTFPLPQIRDGLGQPLCKLKSATQDLQRSSRGAGKDGLEHPSQTSSAHVRRTDPAVGE